jgi:hypothetical protein
MPGSHGSEVIPAINFVRNPARREENRGRENPRYMVEAGGVELSPPIENT